MIFLKYIVYFNSLTLVPLATVTGLSFLEAGRITLVLLIALVRLSLKNTRYLIAWTSKIPSPIKYFLLICAIALVLSPDPQEGLKYFIRIFFSFSVGFVLSMEIRHRKKENILIDWIKVSFYVFSLASLAMFYLTSDVFSPTPGDRTRYYGWGEIHITKSFNFFFAILFVSYSIFSHRKRYWGLAGIAMLLLFLAGQRTILVGLFCGLLVLMCLRYGNRAIVLALPAAGVLFLLLFYTTLYGGRMFFAESGIEELFTVSELSELSSIIQTSGRIDAWTYLWDLFLSSNIIYGNGLGSSVLVFKELFPGLAIIHNDYLMVLYDTGIIGLVFFFLGWLSLITASYRGFKNSCSNELKWMFAASTAGFLGLSITAFADNVLVFSPYHFMMFFCLFLLGKVQLTEYGTRV